MADKIQGHKIKLEVWKKNICRECYDMFHNLTIMSKTGHDANMYLVESYQQLSPMSVDDCSPSESCEVVSHCSFDLYFPDGMSFHTSMSSALFLKWIAFEMLSFRSSLHILDTNSLSDMSFANIFSHL